MGRLFQGGPPLLWLKTGGGTAARCNPGDPCACHVGIPARVSGCPDPSGSVACQPYAGRSWKHSSSYDLKELEMYSRNMVDILIMDVPYISSAIFPCNS